MMTKIFLIVAIIFCTNQLQAQFHLGPSWISADKTRWTNPHP